MKVTNYMFRLAASGESLFLASEGATVAQRLHGAGEQGLAVEWATARRELHCAHLSRTWASWGGGASQPSQPSPSLLRKALIFELDSAPKAAWPPTY